MNLWRNDTDFPTLDFRDIEICDPEELRYRLTWLYRMHDTAKAVRADYIAEGASLADRVAAANIERLVGVAIAKVTAQLRIWARRGGHGTPPLTEQERQDTRGGPPVLSASETLPAPPHGHACASTPAPLAHVSATEAT